MKKRAARKPDRRSDRKPKPGRRRAASAGGRKAPAGGGSKAAGRTRRKTAIRRARTRRPANGAPIDGPEEIFDPAAFAEETSEDAIAEAVEIELLLDEDDPGEPAEIEDDYFFKAPPRNPSLPRVRPAPEIVKRRRAPAAGDDTEPTTVPDHLFARNLKYRYPVAVRAKGVWIHDSDGRDYLDACGGAVVCSIGHGVEEVAAVMTRQAKRLAFAHSSQFITRESTDLAARIAALAPGDMQRNGRVYLVSGGSEASICCMRSLSRSVTSRLFWPMSMKPSPSTASPWPP